MHQERNSQLYTFQSGKKDGTDLSTKEVKGWDKVLPITIKVVNLRKCHGVGARKI